MATHDEYRERKCPEANYDRYYGFCQELRRRNPKSLHDPREGRIRLRKCQQLVWGTLYSDRLAMVFSNEITAKDFMGRVSSLNLDMTELLFVGTPYAI